MASSDGVQPGAESEPRDERHRLHVAPAPSPAAELAEVEAPVQRETQPAEPAEAPRFDDDEWEW